MTTYTDEQLDFIETLISGGGRVTLAGQFKQPVDINGKNASTITGPFPSHYEIALHTKRNGWLGLIPKSINCIVLDSDSLSFDEVQEAIRILKPHAVTRSLSNVTGGKRHKLHLWFRIADIDTKRLNAMGIEESIGNGPWFWNGKKAGEFRYDNHVVLPEPTEQLANIIDLEPLDDSGKIWGLKDEPANIEPVQQSSASQPLIIPPRNPARPGGKHARRLAALRDGSSYIKGNNRHNNCRDDVVWAFTNFGANSPEMEAIRAKRRRSVAPGDGANKNPDKIVDGFIDSCRKKYPEGSGQARNARRIGGIRI